MDDTERYRDELAGHAVGALDAEERARVERLLESDPDAARWRERYARSAGFLPYALPPAAPRPEVREALLDRARRHAALRVAAPVPPPRRRMSAATLLRWAAVVLVVAGLGLWNLDLHRQVARRTVEVDLERLARQPDGPVVALVGTGIPSASARLLVSADGREGQLAVSGLRPLPSERVYQLWFARPGQAPVTGGAFRVDQRGTALALVRIAVPLEEARAIAVTEEPAPASPRPTGPHLLDLRTP